jgi:RNA polymerase sigma-70 factor (ECF subfamily)
MDLAQATDSELIAGYLAGSPEAFEELVCRYEDMVFGLACRVMRDRDEAADACQDTFILLLRKLHTFRGDASFSTWLYRIALNTCRDRLRKQKRHRTYDAAGDDAPDPQETLPAGPGFDPERISEQRDIQERVQAAIATLPPRFREVVLLHDIQGLDYQETAAVLRVALGTVKSRLNRARLKLASELEGLWNS